MDNELPFYITVQKNQNAYAIATEYYGSADLITKLEEDNPGLENLDDDISEGTQIKISPSFYTQAKLYVKKTVIDQNKAFFITVQKAQNIYDIALTWYGSVDKITQLEADNPIIRDLNSTVTEGNVLRISPAYITNKMLYNYYRNNKIIVNTGNTKMGGIGQMGIEVDFIVK